MGFVIGLTLSGGSTVASAKHAYTKQKVSVLNSKGKRVASLGKGITFKYSSVSKGKIKFSYFGDTRYVKVQGLVLDQNLKGYVAKHPYKFGVRLKVNRTTTLYKKSDATGSVGSIQAGTILQSFGQYGNCYKVLINERFRYVRAWDCQKFCLVDVTTFPAVEGRGIRDKLVNYAKKFVGNPYVWGGTSLTNGADCSGFVQGVYKAFGYNLPRCSYQQAEVGKPVSLSKMKPGDLIFYKRGARIGHVTLYIGNGLCVQARGKAYGIVITRYDYSKPAWARRII